MHLWARGSPGGDYVRHQGRRNVTDLRGVFATSTAVATTSAVSATTANRTTTSAASSEQKQEANCRCQVKKPES
jgi:hypothetical protein